MEKEQRSKIIEDVKILTRKAFKECTNEDAWTESQKGIISCLCSKLQNDKWAKKTLGYWYT